MLNDRLGKALAGLGAALLLLCITTNGWFYAGDGAWDQSWGLFVGRQCRVPPEASDCEFLSYREDFPQKATFRRMGWAAAAFGLLAPLCLLAIRLQRRPRPALAKVAMGSAVLGMLAASWFYSLIPTAVLDAPVLRVGHAFNLYLLGPFAIFLPAVLPTPAGPSPAEEGVPRL